jgi:hypothetical protein
MEPSPIGAACRLWDWKADTVKEEESLRSCETDSKKRTQPPIRHRRKRIEQNLRSWCTDLSLPNILLVPRGSVPKEWLVMFSGSYRLSRKELLYEPVATRIAQGHWFLDRSNYLSRTRQHVGLTHPNCINEPHKRTPFSRPSCSPDLFSRRRSSIHSRRAFGRRNVIAVTA